MREPTVKEKLLALVFPSTCFCCGEVLEHAHFLCKDCRVSLIGQRIKKAKVVSRNSVKYNIHSVYYYQDAAKQAIARLKYCNSTRPSKYMGEAIAAKVKRSRCCDFDVVTYVPMDRHDSLQRAYNPAEQIARYTAKHLKLPVKPLLKKVKRVEKQHKLTATERRENVRGAFRANADVRGKRILLIDDVVTTGSTICECAGELLRQGAQRVALYTFCATGGKALVDTEDRLGYNNRA